MELIIAIGTSAAVVALLVAVVHYYREAQRWQNLYLQLIHDLNVSPLRGASVSPSSSASVSGSIE